jgi:hypothetical protein
LLTLCRNRTTTAESTAKCCPVTLFNYDSVCHFERLASLFLKYKYKIY